MTTRRGPRRALFAGAVALALVVAACGGDDGDAATTTVTAGEGSADAALSLLTPTIPATWDIRQTGSTMNTVQLAVNEPLTAYGADGSFTPLLASKVEHPDPTTFLYTLRPGVTFSDGTPLTPEDVKYSYELHMGEDTPSLRARLYTAIASVEVVGGDQVKISLAEPEPEFQYAVASLGIVSKAYYEAHPDDIGTPAAPQIGTGPYVIGDFTPSSSVTLERNPGYWGDAPSYERVTFGAVSDDSSRLLALQSGDFDGVLLPPVSQVAAIQGLGDYTEYSTFDPTIYRVIFDITKPPFDDIHVRKAIGHAIDRDAIVSGVFGGSAQLTESVVPEAVVADMGGDADVAAAFTEFGTEFEFDLDAARAELAQSSVPDGFSIEVPVLADDPPQALVVQVIAQSLAEIGIELTPKQVDFNGWVSVYTEDASDGMIVDQWSAGSPEPASIPRGLFVPGNIGNFSKLDDAAVNDALDTYLAADGDSTAQQAALLDTLAATQALTPYVPLAFLNMYIYLDADVELTAVTPYFWMIPLPELLVPA